MLKLKANWTCSYCSKILKDPIELPCEDSICREHLSDRDVRKENKLKCKQCNDEFRVKDIEFKSNEALFQLIESQSHLSDEETNLKKDLEISIRKFFDSYDEFLQNKSILESDVFDHFHEMRFQIDEQREELKKRIDDIALAMIDETKKHQEKYLRDLKVSFSSFDGIQSLEDKLTEIEETFRHPNLLVETIQEMQQKQDESLRDIQLKLNDMNQVRDDLKASNEFRPNLSSYNQNETSLFGLIRLGLFTNSK
jgi:hypothetical protein